MRLRMRIILPITFGFAALALMIWDIVNQRVIESMGMAWDTGPPVWPYQASNLILLAVNLPAVVISVPLFLLLQLQTWEERFPVLFPAILFWWWWVGTRIDFGLLGKRPPRRPRFLASFLVVAGAALIYAAVESASDGFRLWHLWQSYGGVFQIGDLLLLVRPASVALWSLVGACICLLVAFRPLRKQPTYQATGSTDCNCTREE